MKKIFSIFVLLSVLLGGWSSVVAQVNLDSGLVAHYPLNGNANDENGNGNNDTVKCTSHIADRFKIQIIFFRHCNNTRLFV